MNQNEIIQSPEAERFKFSSENKGATPEKQYRSPNENAEIAVDPVFEKYVDDLLAANPDAFAKRAHEANTKERNILQRLSGRDKIPPRTMAQRETENRSNIFEGKIRYSESKIAEGIWDAVDRLKIILRQAKPRIDQADYAVIVGDDASARVPTWMMRQLMAKIYAERGLPPPETIYFGQPYNEKGMHDLQQQATGALDTSVQKRKEFFGDKDPGRFMVVSETVSKGWHLENIARILKKAQAKYDMAVLGYQSVEMSTSALASNFGLKANDDFTNEADKQGEGLLFLGEEGESHVYQTKIASGVKKDTENPHAHAIIKDIPKQQQRIRAQHLINATRHLASIATDELLQDYRSNTLRSQREKISDFNYAVDDESRKAYLQTHENKKMKIEEYEEILRAELDRYTKAT